MIEERMREELWLVRDALSEAVWRLRAVPSLDVYPAPADLETLRWYADELWSLLKPIPESHRFAMVQELPQLQNWALAEHLCKESAVQASRNIESSAVMARLAQVAAEQMQGPESWRRRVQGFTTAHVANILRVRGELREAEVFFAQAKELWESGSDPQEVLDPGRLFALEASLRRDQRRFEEALALLDEAVKVGRSPEPCLINKGLTLEAMGSMSVPSGHSAKPSPLSSARAICVS